MSQMLLRFLLTLRLGFCLALLLTALPAWSADELTARFEAANLLYEKGQFEPAARGYEALIGEGARSAGLLFNAGNAWFKTGQTGRAVAHWLQAETLEPRNDRIQINLEFARKNINGGAVPDPRWPAPLRRLTLDEWAGIFLVTGWLFFGSLAVGAWKPTLRGALRAPLTVSGLALIASFTLLLITTRERADTVVAVVVSDEAVVRFGPLPESQSAFVARSGTEFRVTDRKDAWLKVEDTQGREGWLLGSQVIQLRAGHVVTDSTPAGQAEPLHASLGEVSGASN